MPDAGEVDATTREADPAGHAVPLAPPAGQAVPRAGKAARKAARKAAKKAAKAAKAAKDAQKAARKAVTKAAKLARKVAKRRSDDAAEASKREARAAKAAATAARSAAPGGKDAGRQGSQAATAVLAELASLVRQASEPAASRIVQRVSEADPGRGPATEEEPPAQAAHGPAMGLRDPGPFSVAAPPAGAPAGFGVRAVPEPTAAPVPAAWGPGLQDAASPSGHWQALAPGADLPEEQATWDEAAEDDADVPPAPAWPTSPVPEPGPGWDPAPDLAVSPVMPATVPLPEGAVIGAAVDVGATSVHLLVAAVGRHHIEPLVDESVFLGLGDRATADGRLGPAAREELVSVLATYAQTARAQGASRITIVGTDPMRRSADAAAAIVAVEARAGVPFHVLDHDEEGLLTLLGVTMGRPLDSSLMVVDVGGGSSEFVVVDPDGHVHAEGLPLGAARLTRELVRSDPPSLAELEALKVRTREILRDAPDIHPGELVAVGGTASNLLRLLPATALDRTLTRRRLTVVLAMLTVERSTEAAERHLVRPARARLLPAGAVIVDAILERYGADRIRVSDEGMREGLVIAAATAGPAWRDVLPSLVRGWTGEAWPGG